MGRGQTPLRSWQLTFPLPSILWHLLNLNAQNTGMRILAVRRDCDDRRSCRSDVGDDRHDNMAGIVFSSHVVSLFVFLIPECKLFLKLSCLNIQGRKVFGRSGVEQSAIGCGKLQRFMDAFFETNRGSEMNRIQRP